MDVGNKGEGPGCRHEREFTPGCTELAVPRDGQVALLLRVTDGRVRGWENEVWPT